MGENPINEAFESSFLTVPLEKQISQCDVYELAPLFRSLLPDAQPVLEAGCGSGRWVAWFTQRGWQAAGLDWSAALCERARHAVPGARFEVGDMRRMPFSDGEFGSIVALGSIEHAPEGPMVALAEFHRVLRAGGVAIITVPHGGGISRAADWVREPVARLKGAAWLRRVFGKPEISGSSLRQARKGTRSEWHPRFSYNSSGWFFYEYHFNRSQMLAFLAAAKFEVTDAFAAFKEEGVMHSFGPMAGRFNYTRGQVSLTPLGSALCSLLEVQTIGHMLVFVVRKR